MSEYIKREDAEQSIVGYFTPKTYDGNDVDRAFKIAGAILNHIPTADVVEVVRCKDCMWGNNKTRSGKRYCELSDMYEVDDGFCNWGEKIK